MFARNRYQRWKINVSASINSINRDGQFKMFVCINQFIELYCRYTNLPETVKKVLRNIRHATYPQSSSLFLAMCAHRSIWRVTLLAANAKKWCNTWLDKPIEDILVLGMLRLDKATVITLVFVQPKNTNFLKKFLQCVLHGVSMSNPSQIPSFLDLSSRLGRRNLVHTNSLVA